MKRIISILLSVIMILISYVTCFSVYIQAEELSPLTAETKIRLDSALNYINALTINNNTNVPSVVVPKFGSQFTWDNEKRETANKSYLFEWSYYNGVVFEGIEDIYDYTKSSTYRDYVEAYMEAMIASDGSWAKCTSGNTSKDAAGYVDYHGADCYKTASLLIDMAKDANGNVNTNSKYYKRATAIYNDLTTGTGSSYSKSDLGYNYWHSNWNSQTAPTYKVWLDGIYMIQPFMAEYAYYSNDTAQMSKILQRFQWLYNNDRNATTGLYYHALNSASDYCNFHWTRAIGWYAMAVVDCMQYMSGSQLDAMKVILKDLVDNMLPYQDASTGMWANLCNKAVTSTNRLETSGTAMMAYTIAKGINNGWLDDSYAQYAEAAFAGMVQNKLSGSNLSDIYFKASASGSDNYQTTSNYYTNEGKGVGPFIMAYAQVKELYDKSLIPEEPDEPELNDLTDAQTGIEVEGTTATAITVTDVSSSYSGRFTDKLTSAYDITLTGYTQGDTVTVSIPVPANYKRSTLAVYYIPESGNPVSMDFTYENSKVYFETNHMSVYALTGTPLQSGDDVNYPPFPEEGSVKIDKWATGEQLENTGVGEVSLSVVGVPPFYSNSVDVLFVTDVSNSMAWVAGTTTNATGTEKSKLNDMQNAVAQFSQVLLQNNVTGDVHNNTISFVTFGGLDKQHEQNTSNVKNWSTYADPTRTLFTSYDNYNAVTSAVNNIKYTVDGTTVYITFDGSTGSATSDVSYGGTNYDYGFMEASSAIEQIKANYKAKTGKNYETSNRGIYVIFVTDGAPTHYNGTMYRYDSDTTRPDKNETWINSSGNEVVYTGGSNNSNYTQANWYNYIKNTDSYWATQVYNTDGVAGMSALGIDLDNGGFNSWVFTESSGYPLKNFVESIVTNETLDVYLADDSAEMAQSLLDMAGQISSASGSSYVIDTMGAQFNLQMANTVNHTASGSTIVLSDYNITPKMTVKKYNTYHLGDVGTRVNGVTVTSSMIGQHITETPEVVEEITFNAAGTEAYSTAKTGNIMSNGVINASNFVYNANSTAVTVGGVEIPAESILWKLGSLQEDELVITYNVYLDASMQGGCPAGTYDTNEEATLHYKNYLGNDCELEYPVPNLSWDDAKVSYELYLVDANGNPVNGNGARVSFENRTVMSELVELEKYLNSATVIDKGVLNELLPDGYMLYNEDASYTGIISSNELYNSSVIDDEKNSTFVFDPTGTTIASDGKVNGISDYTDIKVAFAIVKLGLNPDMVVVDYGKAITIDPLANDVGNFVINGLTLSAPQAGMNTAQTVKTANGNFAVQTGTEDTSVIVPVGNNIVSPFTLADIHYVYPTKGTVTTTDTTTLLRYKVEANGKVTKYAANSTSGVQIAASLANGAYVIDGDYAITVINGIFYIVRDYEIETTTTQREVDRTYYQTGNNTSATVSVSSTSSNSRTTLTTLPDGTVISAYYATQRSGSWWSQTTYYYVYIYEGSTRVATLSTGNSGSYAHTLNGMKDINGNNITITVSLSRTSSTNQTNARNITVTYPSVTSVTTTDIITDTVETLKTGYKKGTETVTYSLFNYLSTIDTIYYYASPESAPAKNSDSANLLYSTIKVIPATTVYYEDDFGGSTENGGLYIKYTGDWYTVTDDGVKTEGVSANTDINDRQDRGEVGQGHVPYDFDSSYENNTKFSNGSAATATGSVSVVNGVKQFDASAQFTFTGTGFDIISRTDMDCGMISVLINDDEGNFIDNVPVINKGIDNLYQIPVISYTGIPYGTYTVTINVNAPMKLLGINSSVFYLDAIRIYNPMGLSTSDNADFAEANDAYKADKEANVYSASIRDYILSIKDLGAEEVTGAVYVDTIDNDYTNGQILNQDSIKDFELIGPNEEVYLTPGYGVGFIVECSGIPDSVQLAMKTPNSHNHSSTLRAQTYGSDKYVDLTVSSATEMNYDITNAIDFVKTNDGYYKALVILTNGLENTTEKDVISVTNIKMTYPESVTNIVHEKDYPEEEIFETASVLSAYSDLSRDIDDTVYVNIVSSWDTYADSFKIIKTQYIAAQPDYEVTLYNYNEDVPAGKETFITAKTSQYVNSLSIIDENGNPVDLQISSSLNEKKLYTEDYKYAKVWAISLKASQGEHVYTIIPDGKTENAVNVYFTVSAPIVEKVELISKPEKTQYYIKEDIDFAGIKLKVTYSDGTEQIVRSGFTTNYTTATKIGKTTIQVTYEGYTVSYQINTTLNIIYLIKSIFKPLLKR